ncbi:MAG TPA: hypothetical protein VK638_23200 [Edaphobacter sp.]|nr:hypothetical protein [Edaphobacter sp.]
MRDLIGSSGVHLLHNQSTVIDGLTLVGVADYWSGEFAPEQAFAGTPRTTARILLCHNPDAKRDLAHLRQSELIFVDKLLIRDGGMSSSRKS